MCGLQLNGQAYLVFGHAGQRLTELVSDHPHLVVQALDVVALVLSNSVLNNDIKPGHFYARLDVSTSLYKCDTMTSPVLSSPLLST